MRIGYVVDINHRLPAAVASDPKAIGAAMESLIAEAVLADSVGFHSVGVPDRHGIPDSRFPGPEQLLTILARETTRAALGSFTFIGTLVHPMKAAEQFAVIDHLSGGRLYTTVSRGFLPAFWGQFGIPEGRMLGRFQETLRIWRLAFEDRRFDFDGKHWQVRDGRLSPQPRQAGGWPIWGGGNASPVAAARSADYADCWTSDPLPMTDEVWAERAGAYRARALELGKPPLVVAMRNGWVGDSFEQAAREFGDHYLHILRFYQRNGQLAHHPDLQSQADITLDRAAPHLIIGSPAECIEQLERLHEERGIGYVAMCSRLATGPSFQQVREQIQRFGEEVVAPIHAKYAAPLDHPAIPAACRW